MSTVTDGDLAWASVRECRPTGYGSNDPPLPRVNGSAPRAPTAYSLTSSVPPSLSITVTLSTSVGCDLASGASKKATLFLTSAV